MMVLTHDLRQSVLYAAVQGQLTEQLDTDSSVHEYYDLLQREKEQYDFKRKARHGQNIDEIREEEITFDIPSSWKYVRLIDIVKSISAGGDRPKNFSKVKTSQYNIEVISNGETNNGVFGYTDKATISERSLTISGRGTIGFSVIREKPYVPIVRLLVILPLSGTNIEYIQLASSALIEYGSGTAVKQLTVPMISPKIIPFPPIEEQQRIVDRVNELMAQIDEYEKIEKQLITLKATFPRDMRSSILQAGMQGKLTEQLDTDSSVDDLLATISREKEALIKAGQIDKPIRTNDILDSDVPFSIPATWKWVRWGNLSNSIQYGYNAPGQPSGDALMVRISDIVDSQIKWEGVPYCSIDRKLFQVYQLFENDLLFARTGGTVGKSVLAKTVPPNTVFAGYLIRSNYSKRLVPQYLKYFMESELYWQQLRDGTTRTAQPNCNGKTLSKMMIPLPPIEEQQRIVEQLDKLLPLCEQLV